MKTRIEEMVEEMFDTVYHTGEQPNLNKEWLRKALTKAHQAGYADGYERGKQARTEDNEVEVRDSMCEYWYKKGIDDAVEAVKIARGTIRNETSFKDSEIILETLETLQDNK